MKSSAMIHRPSATVLIVEDERIVAKDIQQTLLDLGYDAFAIASSAEEAIVRASERCPDIVLMDIRIKGERDGIDTAAILKNRYGVPIVYLTAHADEATIARAKKTEPHGYLLKPVTSAELRSVIEVSLYRHEMEKRLRERERWFSTTLRSISDAVITVDLAGSVTFMNAAAEALTGANAGASVGKHVHDVFQLVLAPGDESPVLKAIRDRRSVELQEGDLVNVSSGARLLIHDSAAPVIDDEKHALGAVMVFRDVTEQKKLRRQLELADRLASLGTMAAGVAHEINNPLAVVVANSSFLADELSTLRSPLGAAGTSEREIGQRMGEMSEALTDLQSAASRIGQIVSDLRAFSRPPQPAIGNVDVAQCVEWAVRTTAHELRHRAKLTASYTTVPFVRADEARLGQVFINLLVNAAHAIAPGSADRNEVCISTRTDEVGRVVAEIRDTGTGISSENLKRIFDPFFTTKDVGEGTGLGLSICLGIVTSLGGEIQVDSEIGRGSVFRIVLPAAAHEGAVPAAASRAVAPLRGRILVVDDDDIVLRAITRILRNHEVVCTQSAREALRLLEQGERFDIILSDLMMPNMTGVQLYEALLHMSPEQAWRIVFISGGATTAKIDDFLRTVPNLLIEKPFELASFLETVQQLLEAQRKSEQS